MSETVKLIIEIPKEDIEFICKTSFVADERTMFKQSPSDRQGTMMLFRLMDSVKDGTPLEEVRSEIIQLPTMRLFEGYFYVGYDSVLKIIDNIGKGDKGKC